MLENSVGLRLPDVESWGIDFFRFLKKERVGKDLFVFLKRVGKSMLWFLKNEGKGFFETEKLQKPGTGAP